MLNKVTFVAGFSGTIVLRMATSNTHMDVAKPIGEAIADIVNQINSLQEQNIAMADEIKKLRNELNNHNHYSQAGSMGQR